MSDAEMLELAAKAAAQTQCEPVAWQAMDRDGKWIEIDQETFARLDGDNNPFFRKLYLHPGPAQTSAFDANAERWRLDSEELEAFHMSMDKFDVPRATKFGVVMSAFGRAVKYAAMLPAAPAKPEGV